MVTVLRYGYYNTSASPSSGVASDGFVRAYTEDAPAQHLWAYQFGGRVGRPGVTSPTFRYGAYLANSNKEPNTRVGQSEQKSATTFMSVGSEGAIVYCDVTTADDSPSNSAIQLWSGLRYSLGILSDADAISHGQINAADISASEERFFDRTASSGATTTHPTTFGSYTGDIEGHMTIWLECHDNEAPRVPVNRTPSGTIQTLVPVMEGDFRDRNGDWGPGNSGFNDGDEMNAYQIQVRRSSDLVSFWLPGTFSANSTEKSGNKSSVTYAGTTLVRGTQYEWRIRHQDMFNAWSDWSDWLTFTPANLGYVTLNDVPTGKQEAITGIDFKGRWFHNSATSTNAVEIRLKQGTTIVRTSPTITKTVASSASPGTLFTITWAETTFADLDWGKSYTYEIRGRDTGGQWSDWSAGRAFTTNAVPSTPTNLSPANSQIVTGLPLLSFSMSDTDDTTGTGLTGKVRLYDSTGRWLATRTATYNATSLKWEYQMVASGTSEAKRFTFGGTISGGSWSVTYHNTNIGPIASGASNATVLAAFEAHPDIGTGNVAISGSTASGSAITATFQGALAGIDLDNVTVINALTGTAPTVVGTTFTSGTGDIATAGTFSFVAYGYDGTVYSGGTLVELSATTSSAATFVYSTGPTVTITAPTESSTVTTVSPTITWSVSGGTQAQYRVQIFASDDVTQVYDSVMAVGAATSLAIPASYLTNNTNYGAVVSVISTVPQNGFSSTRHFTLSYTEPTPLTGVQAVPVKIGTDPVPSAIRVSWNQATTPAPDFVRYILRRTDLVKPLALITSQSQTDFIDYTPRSGVEYTYRVRQVAKVSGINVAGTSVFVNASIALDGVVLASVDSPDTYRAVLSFGQNRKHTHTANETMYMPWNADKPTTIRGLVNYWTTTGTFNLIDDNRVGVTAQQRMDEIEALTEYGGIMCYRDERGRKRFVTLIRDGMDVEDVFPFRNDITLTIRQEAYEEGLDEEEI